MRTRLTTTFLTFLALGLLRGFPVRAQASETIADEPYELPVFTTQAPRVANPEPAATFAMPVLIEKCAVADANYLQRTAPTYLIVDVSLFPAVRGQGLGTALIGAVQEQAAAQGWLDENTALFES